MRKVLKVTGAIMALTIIALLGYGAKGYFDAVQSAEDLRARADSLIASDRGPNSLNKERLRVLLLVQDPGFYQHSGVDLSTPGAGLTTLTQSVSKRLAFDHFRPGIGKIRQTGFALGLDRNLTKNQQIALFLETAEMGQSTNGWVTGFHRASEIFFKKTVNEITDEEFYSLVAVLIAPGKLKLAKPDNSLRARVQRISKLARGDCKPTSLIDNWLDGCK